MPSHHKVIIIGSGPAGLTAAIYASRSELQPLVVAGSEPGGQLTLTTGVGNYPGFSEDIQGPDLMEAMRNQALRFGTTIVDGAVTSADLAKRPFTIHVGEEKTYTADCLIVATGASAKWLGLPSEQRLRGKGVSSCATCDGFFFKGKDIVVVGGGDTAMEDATFLTRFANVVTVLVRGKEPRASALMLDRAKKNPKIRIRVNATVAEVLGEGSVSGVRVKDVVTNAEDILEVQGLFIAIGHTPNSGIFHGQLTVDTNGFIAVHDLTKTNVEGVFVCGDVQDPRYRQAVVAAGSGAMAAIDAERYLQERGEK